MQHIKNQDLTHLNTFHIRAFARDFFIIENDQELPILFNKLSHYHTSPLILGGGSNILFVKNPSMPVVHLANNRLHLAGRHTDYDIIEVEAGMKWDDLVRWTVENNYYGLVNLSYIPGTVGAAPVQNIGAYGEEVGNFITHVHIYNTARQRFETLSYDECSFGYRTSIFKTALRGKAIITRVGLRLPKRPRFNLSYRDLHFLKDNPNLNLWLLRLTIGKIRMTKLPDPSIIGNAGSFFKNPIIPQEKFSTLQSLYPDIPRYPMPGGKIKIPAGWLIDKLGLKGYRHGNAGVYENNALVLVNHGNATGEEILELSRIIQSKVKEAFDIDLVPEVNIIQ